MNKSRRVASETGLSIGISESGSDATIIPQDGSTVDKEGELTSPPHTPRLGSLPSSTSATFTPGSSAPYSPLKSPLSRRSFFGISSSPSKQSLSLSPSSSSSSTSPVVKEERVRLTEGRALPVSSRPRQGANHRALSYAPFTASSSHATVVQRNRIYSSAIKREMNNEEVAFVPFHPFSDSDYRASSLDLSGTSALTMSLHFSEHVGKEGGRGEAQSQLRR